MTEVGGRAGTMRILYISQWFEPEPILKGARFVRGLIDRGHAVETVTGFPNYPVGKIYPGYRMALHRKAEEAGVPIHRVALYPSHDRSSARRIVNYFSFALSAALHGLVRAEKFDVLYVYQPLPSALGAALICIIRRRPFVMDIQDLWPDSVVNSGMPGTSWMGRIIGVLCNFAYRRATRIVAQSQGIAARLVERGVPVGKIDVIFNWADEHAPAGTVDPSRYGFEGRFNIVYGGNFGRVQGLDALIRAAAIAGRTIPELQLTLIGNGVETDRLRAVATELDTPNVRVEPGIPREQIADVFEAADVLAIHLVKNPLFEITIPSKTQSYLAAGKPILVGVEGEAGRIVTEAGAGIAVESNNVQAIADAMIRFARMPKEELKAMGARGLEAYSRSFTFDKAMDETVEAMRRAVADYAR